MKNLLIFIVTFILMCLVMIIVLKACDYEAEHNEIKNKQWVQDYKDGKPYTNYGE